MGGRKLESETPCVVEQMEKREKKKHKKKSNRSEEDPVGEVQDVIRMEKKEKKEKKKKEKKRSIEESDLNPSLANGNFICFFFRPKVVTYSVALVHSFTVLVYSLHKILVWELFFIIHKLHFSVCEDDKLKINKKECDRITFHDQQIVS